MTTQLIHSSPAAFSFDAAFGASHQRLPPVHRTHATQAPTLPSESLLKGHKVVEIVHNGNLYKLQATKLGKLILTK